MFSFGSLFRSKAAEATKLQQLGHDSQAVPRSLEINANVVEGEEEFVEITTRRKTYLEVARELFPLATKNNSKISNGTPVYSMVSKRKTAARKDNTRELEVVEDELSVSVDDDFDGVNYDLRKSNRHVLKIKNKRTPSYLKELKAKKLVKKQELVSSVASSTLDKIIID